MRKLIAFLLAAVILLSCTGSAFATSASASDTKSGDYKVRQFTVPNTDAIRFVQNLKVGINLGNTFDAYDEGNDHDVDYETVWCRVKTTPALIAKIKEAGFNTIRIPVSWHNHLNPDGSFDVSGQWLDRINEVVDYCIGQGMYVILNIHHDDSRDYLYPSYRTSANSVEYITAIWSCLAKRFQNYDEHLIFESMNEPRLVGCLYEWMLMPISLSCMDAVSQINLYNQTFVNVVRSSGGFNKTRYLLCPGYDASVDGAMNPGYVLPKDPVNADSHIIVAVHAYTPNSFAQQANGVSRWSSKSLLDTAPVTVFMDKLYCKFISCGTAVLLDEFGAVEKKGNTAARADYAGFFVANARARGMSCLWWDNNIASGSGERFGLIDRASLQWVYPDIVHAMIKNS